MKNPGSALVVLLLALLTSTTALGAVEASVDRRQIAMGDTLRLTLKTDGDEDLQAVDFSPLEADFEVLQRSSSSSMRIINGRQTRERSLILDLVALRQGTLAIPALRVGSETTRPIAIEVEPPPTAASIDDNVIFEAEVDSETVYVQGQLMLTLRLQQAINLDARSITEFTLDNAFVKQLGQNSYQRNIGGRTWLVHEIRYVIFPEQSGGLVIPPLTFTAREVTGRRGLFDRGSGRPLRRATDPIAVTVLPTPPEFTGGTWLPATSLEIEESWSIPPEQLTVGDSATRTVRLVGAGLQGAQLPPIGFDAPEGLKYYPDQPLIEDRESSSGLTGVREDSAALVPTRAGRYTLPEVRIPWWDTEAGVMREAILPARVLEVAPGSATAAAPPAPVAAADSTATVTAPPPAADADGALLWQVIAGVSSTGWLLTLAWLFSRRSREAGPASPGQSRPGEASAYKRLLAACAGNNPAAARQTLLEWGTALFPADPPRTLGALQRRLASAELDGELQRLEQTLYAPAGGNWDGAALAATVKALRGAARGRRRERTEAELTLYPPPKAA
jgi:hypothetical protein